MTGNLLHSPTTPNAALTLFRSDRDSVKYSGVLGFTDHIALVARGRSNLAV